ncbi:hypothetical protein ASPACDRAFT_59397 [Aspergillus aculeatus ATCC 16872]|uniref:DUF7029 domain-containing protein n=1 Tax=Aspergillus aculeatus (strain ATCC 16872 / CBS 172.66 / WB 5094) TaxID=690307 RepID=A0A1L9WZQ7_ASPA1|nr:uncharacterized protein ASPACDRAFT_59397 [Aspergillus aculeatus ATCC 16872]OJK01747.1 hypothetical protein ASPACDRAFT_59397 [Aspergillus aculeatus ATCC 16872]
MSLFAVLCLMAVRALATEHLLPIKRAADVSQTGIAPEKDITLYYQAASQPLTAATVDAQMNLPTVVLEDITTISSVSCSAEAVEIVFASTTDYQRSVSAWPSSSFILLTNHLGNCDAENERGVYLVDSSTVGSANNTITAQTTRSSFRDQAQSISVLFNASAVASRKRDWTISVSDEWSGELINTKDLAIDVQDVSLSTTLDLSGGVELDVTNSTATSLYLELDLALLAELNVSAQATAAYSTDVWTYTYDALSVSAFEITGILSVGPSLTLAVGVEFGVTGEANVTVDLSTQITSGTIYLDLLQSGASTSSGWTPTQTASATLSGEVDAQLNPFADVELAVGVNVLDGLLEVSAGVEAKAEVVNTFSVAGAADVSSTTGVTAVTGAGACSNGYWFTSDFLFDVDAFVTSLYTATLYTVTVPIFATECFAF